MNSSIPFNQEEFNSWKINLNEIAANWWEKHHGVTHFILNNRTAGIIVKITDSLTSKPIAQGLKYYSGVIDKKEVDLPIVAVLHPPRFLSTKVKEIEEFLGNSDFSIHTAKNNECPNNILFDQITKSNNSSNQRDEFRHEKIRQELELYVWKINLNDSVAERWKKEHGITTLLLNDVAAGVIIEIHNNLTSDSVIQGLRCFLEVLWQSNLVRPVIGVFYSSRKNQSAVEKELTRCTWDDSIHRGDFSLRAATKKEDAIKLILKLLSDSFGFLDDENRSKQISVDAVQHTLKKLRKADIGELEIELTQALLDELKSGDRTNKDPELKSTFNNWISTKGLDDDIF